MNKILRAVLIGIGVFAYIPLTFFAYVITVGLVYDTNWFEVDVMLLVPNIIFLMTWFFLPITFISYLLLRRKRQLK